MKRKYPNKKKRKGFWKRYEQANIKDYRQAWDLAIEIIVEEDIPFTFSKRGRTPNLTRIEVVAMTIVHVYFTLDFRETEHMLTLLINKHLDHSNCVRWFGKLNLTYVDNLVFILHHRITQIDNSGDYIADSTEAICDRLKHVIKAGKDHYYHDTWKSYTSLFNISL